MFSLKSPFQIVVAVLVVITGSALGQAQNTDFKIQKIEPDFLHSPGYTGPQYDKRGTRGKDWLEVEVTFEWQPPQRAKDREPRYTDELTFNYYILLKNKPPQAHETLLVGSVTHTSIPQEKDLHSVVYVSPRTLERFFEGKVPASADQALVDVGVTITKQGQEVASTSWKSRTGSWWPQFTQTPGFVLDKNETPFAPLAWDYYEAIKPRAGE
ncbi:MAG TPA: Amuc_1102 family pilus-like protein [Terrimicrobiaceae bacterium]